MTARTARLAIALVLAFSLPAASVLAAPSTGTRSRAAWQLMTPLPFNAWGNAGASVDRCSLLSIGGQDETGLVHPNVASFDPQANTWSSLAPMPEARFGITAAVVAQKVYVIGGYINSDPLIAGDNFIYDAGTNTWTSGAPIPVPGGIATAAEASVLGRVYVIGGDNGDLNSNDSNLVYDPTTDKWRVRAPMPTPRENNVAVALRGKIYVAGGLQAQTSFDGLTTFESYDPTTNTWTTLAPMNFPRISPGIATDGRYIYVFGGASTYDPSTDLRTAERYDPTTNSWSSVPRMVVAVNAAGSGYASGRLFSVGGSYTNNNQALAVNPTAC